MEPKSDLRAVQPETWRAYIPERRDGRAWRPGQERTWSLIAERPEGASVFVQLPTGYGKTITICGAYVIQRARGIANRLLILVPTDQLREQMAPSRGTLPGLLDDFDTMRFTPKGVVAVSKNERDLRYARDGIAEVFVATYAQAISDPGFWRAFMHGHRWMVACDEAHHLSDENTWGAAVQALSASFRLYLSATPIRNDKQGIIGLATEATADGAREIKPDVVVSYADAMRDGAARRVQAQIHDYFVDVLLRGDDVPRRITTADLRAEGVVSFSEYQAKSQLRYTSKYLSGMLKDACAEWRVRELKHRGQNQLLVFAMTNAHARAVVEQLRSLAPDVRTDWIGQDRSVDENRDVLERFNARGPGGAATGGIDCLVQVDKAGEGFDNARCSVLVFLHLIGSEPKLKQQIGRGLRRNYALPVELDTVTVYASSDTEIARYAQDMDETARVALGLEVETQNERERAVFRLPDFSVEIADVELRTIETIADGVTLDRAMVDLGASTLAEMGIDAASVIPAQLARLGAKVSKPEGNATKDAAIATPRMTETAAVEVWRDRVTKATAQIAKHVIEARSGRVIEKSVAADTIKTLHAEWKRTTGRGHDGMTSAELQRKYYWLRSIEASIIAGRVPLWLAR